jgi:hypothetical protein
MTLKELTREEKLGLVALTATAVMTDASVSEGEIGKLDEIVNDLGEDTFRELAEEAEERFTDEDALKAFLSAITRQEARELIYGTVLNEALTDTIAHSEAAFLEWLAKTWNIDVNIQDA